jgi:FkbM family methyltransferase
MEGFEHEYDLGKAVLITPKRRDFKMLVTPRYVGHYYENVYEEFTADLVSNIVRADTCFIDIGAHSGFYTLLVGTKHKNAKIIAFEPVPENFSLFAKNLELNGLKNIRAYNLAVSDREETRVLNITEASDSAGFYQHPLTRTIKTMEVKTVALDNFLRDLGGLPIVVKIDTEGHELHVLEGMRKIIEETEDVRLVVEFNPSCLTSGGCQPKSFLEKIDQSGFEIFFIDDQRRQTYKLGENIDSWASLITDKVYVNLLCVKKQKSLSVTFFSHSSQILGGAERSLLELTRELIRDHGVICCVVLPNDGPLRQEVGKVGASTLIVNYSWWCDASLPSDDEISFRLSNSFKAVLDQLRELKKINSDIIFTNTLVIPWGTITALFLGRPHVWFVHELGKLDHDFKFYLPFRSVLGIIKDSSNVIFTNSNAVRKVLFGETSDRNILTIYYNIEIPPDALNQVDGSNYFTRREATKLVISGSITETKGQEDAILAVKELIDRKKDVELIIMGPALPSYLRELEKIVRDEKLKGYVHFHEFRENPYPVVNQADIVLLSSRREAFGRVTLEAMLLKKPVIGTNSGGTLELIREGYNGLLYEPGNYRQLADKIEYLIEHRDKLVEFGEKGLEFAKTTFTKEKYGGEVYQRLTDLRSAANFSSSPYLSFVTERLLDLQAAVKAEREAVAAERDGFAQTVSQLQARLQNHEQTLAEKEHQLAQVTAERDRLAQQLIHGDAQQREALSRVAATESQIAEFQAALQFERQALATIHNALGWRILNRYHRARESWKALAFIHTAITVPIKKLLARNESTSPTAGIHDRSAGEKFLRTVYHRLPLSDFHKKRFKWFVFRRFGFLLKNTGAYRFWEVHERALSNFVSGASQLPKLRPVTELTPFEFAQVDEPVVSIVIPVYNHIEFTYRCLKSLKENPSVNSYEIIIVDDCSNDRTQEFLACMKGIRVLRNERNGGFIYSCNAGAAAARGKYIWFLNNDTLVTSNSLDALVATFSEFPDAGLVGSKLIYPDGKLQEAGGVIWGDASGWNYGRGDNPDKPQYSYLREVDYCSGASILIPNSVFHEMGGFDRRYVPAYYEDADLAFSVRKAGKKVLFQPLSRIVHTEGVSSGTDVRAGVKSFQEVNRVKFYDRWKDTLARHGSPGINPHREKDRYVQKRILMIDACTPTPDKDAGSVVVSCYMKILRLRSHKITFVPADNFLYVDPYTASLQRVGIESLYAPYVMNVESYLVEHGSEYDIVILFRVQFAAKYIDVVRKYCSRALVIFFPHDLHYLREERQAVIEGSQEIANQAKYTKEVELEVVHKVDGTIVVSEAERQILNQEVPDAIVTMIPLLFDVPGSRAGFEQRSDMFFLGGYQHEPNVDAVIYFVRSIWPLVRRRLPGVRFYILGSDVAQEIFSLASDDVVVVGYVEDLSSYLDRCRISVVPLRYGAGMKGKIGTSMSYGVPCVGTSVAVEGMGLAEGENILVADHPEDFARKVETLYNDKALWGRLSANGLSFVETNWSIKAGEKKLIEFLDQLAKARACSKVVREFP